MTTTFNSCASSLNQFCWTINTFFCFRPSFQFLTTLSSKHYTQLQYSEPSHSGVDCVLRRNTLRMKQVYRVPFVRNSDKVKQLCYDYVQVSHIHFHNWLRPISTDTLLYCIVIQSNVIFKCFTTLCRSIYDTTLSILQDCSSLSFFILHFSFFFCWLYWPISYCLFCANHLHIQLCLLWCIGYSTFGKNKEIF